MSRCVGALVWPGVRRWMVERWLWGVGSGRVETASSGMTSPLGSDVVVDGEFDGECGGLVVADRVAVEVAWLVGPAGGGDGPGSTSELSGYCGVGRDVVVASFDDEPPIVRGELGVVSPGNVGGLVESES